MGWASRTIPAGFFGVSHAGSEAGKMVPSGILPQFFFSTLLDQLILGSLFSVDEVVGIPQGTFEVQRKLRGRWQVADHMGSDEEDQFGASGVAGRLTEQNPKNRDVPEHGNALFPPIQVVTDDSGDGDGLTILHNQGGLDVVSVDGGCQSRSGGGADFEGQIQPHHAAGADSGQDHHGDAGGAELDRVDEGRGGA